MGTKNTQVVATGEGQGVSELGEGGERAQTLKQMSHGDEMHCVRNAVSTLQQLCMLTDG